MKICKRCILTDTHHMVKIEDNLCNFCKQHDIKPKITQKVLGEKKLYELINSRKKINFQCIVPLSGGKDSSYILYYIVKKLKLKTLAVYFNNGFSSEWAKMNISHLCRKLNVPLIIENATTFFRKQIKHSLLASNAINRILPTICGNCENNIRTTVLNTAKKRKIPFVIWGATNYEDSKYFLSTDSLPFLETYGTKEHIKKSRGEMLNFVSDNLCSKLDMTDKTRFLFHIIILHFYKILDNIRMSGKLYDFGVFNPFREVAFNSASDPNIIYFYDYIKYEPYKFIQILKKQIGWDSPSDQESRMDCLLSCFSSYRILMEAGFSSYAFKASILIRYKLLDRLSAIKKEEKIRKRLKGACQRTCCELKLPFRVYC